MPLVIPRTFATSGAGTPGSYLDDDFSAVAAWINARDPVVGPIGSRPAAGNVGALYVASDQGNLLYVDTGSAWLVIGALASSIPGAAFLGFQEIATPSAPPANQADLYLKAATLIERPYWQDSGGQEQILTSVLGRTAPATLVSSAAETTLHTQTVKANTLNGVVMGARLTYLALLQHNSGSPNGATFRFKFGGITLCTLATGNLATSGLGHGLRLVVDLGFQAGGGTPPYGAQGALQVGNPGVGGTSVGLQVQDY